MFVGVEQVSELFFRRFGRTFEFGAQAPDLPERACNGPVQAVDFRAGLRAGDSIFRRGNGTALAHESGAEPDAGRHAESFKNSFFFRHACLCPVFGVAGNIDGL
ncbi:MAG: hypothetical protein WD407_02715 [Rhodospirillales bacterium]